MSVNNIEVAVAPVAGAGRHFTAFPSPGLSALSMWGVPTVEDVAELERALPSVTGSNTLVDIMLLDGVAPKTYEALVELTRRYRGLLREQVPKLALVRGASVAGSVAASFLEVARGSFPMQTFTELEPAAAWLGAPAGWTQELLARRSGLAAVPPLLLKLRDIFRQVGVRSAASAEVARRLAVSQRTLVRRLSKLGTSFQRELTRFRIGTAQSLMRDTDSPLCAIALDAGFGSFQHFCTAFRQATGETPGVWRDKSREPLRVA
jgi:AraC-like DNA-binding protein